MLIQFVDTPYAVTYSASGEAYVQWPGGSNVLSLDGYAQVSVEVAGTANTRSFDVLMGKISGATLASPVAADQPADMKIHTYPVVGPEIGLVLRGTPNTTDHVQFWVHLSQEATSGVTQFCALPTAAGQSAGRTVIQYKTAQSVQVRERFFHMLGFRFWGAYTASSGPVLTPAAGQYPVVVQIPTDLGAEGTVPAVSNWYAVFACSNANSTSATFKLMPFLRVAQKPERSEITFNEAGEGVHRIIPRRYNFATDALAGVGVLVITETLDGRPNAFSGRITTITGNSALSLTLADPGGIDAFDYLLPAPPGYAYHRYLTSFYYDGEIRNIHDTGGLVKAKMIYYQQSTIGLPPDDCVPGNPGLGKCFTLNWGGYISPLATAVALDVNTSLSTASTGTYYERYDGDQKNHTLASIGHYKVSTGTETFHFADIALPFSFSQRSFLRVGGTLGLARNPHVIEIKGWIEP